MRRQTALLAVLLCATRLALCDEGHHHSLTEEEVGSVHFSTSCQPALANHFNRAVALLHSFQYEQARQAFTDIVGKDPQCAMAAWGATETRPPAPWPWARQNRSPRATRRPQLGKRPTSMPWLKFIGKTAKI